MPTNFELASEFMRLNNQDVYSYPSIRDQKTQELRYELIREELEELQVAFAQSDLVQVADALTDLLYVVYGAGHSFGLDLDACYREVHRSNMSKLGADGKPVYREDGKILKGPNYSPPDLVPIILSPKPW